MSRKNMHECQICHTQKSSSQLMPAEMVRTSVAELILSEHPNWTTDGYICLKDLNHYRTQHVENILLAEKGELSQLELDVVASFKAQDLIATDVEQEIAKKITFGEWLADKIAVFGGSWTFLISFGIVLATWIIINTLLLSNKPFDPYPFILLNLVLSCLAAIQAPVIMMSQNRQEAKDRLRAENDYSVNLKAEVEIRQLHSKLDMLLTHQWQRLLEIQQMQMDLIQEVGKSR